MGSPMTGSRGSWVATANAIKEHVSVSSLICRRICAPTWERFGLWKSQLKMHYFNSLLTFPFSRIGIKGNCFQPKTFGTLLSPAEVYGVLSGTMPGNRSWTFLGKRISPKCLATLLGIRPQRFQRCASGRLDQRYRCFGSDTWVNLNYLLLPPGYCEIQHVLFNQNEMVSVS